MQGVHLRKYGVEATIDFDVYEVDGVDLRTDWVPAAADCEVMKDGGASTQCTNTATDEGSTYSIVLTATEMQAARLVLKVVDAATKVFLDTVIIIETYGHASAQHAVDLDDTVRAGLTALPNAAADAAGGLPISDAGGLDIDATDANVSAILTDTAEIGTAGAGLTDLGGMSTGMKAEVNAEADTALTDYDPPTKTELDSAFTEIKGATWASGTDTLEHIRDKQTDIETDTAEIGTAGAGLTDLGGMSTGMKAEVNAEADTAISDYDPPTKGEMDTAHGLLATEAKQDIIDTVVDAIKAKTDDLTFTTANEVDVNVHSINDVTVKGVGTTADPWAPDD